MTSELILEGLDCANCANKIENEVNNIDGVEAKINFVNKTLTIKTENNYDEILNKVKNIISKHEPHVKIMEKNKQNYKEENHIEEEENIKKEIIKLIIGAIVFAIGLIFPFSPTLDIAIFLLSYFILGYEVLARAVKGIFKGQMFNENF